MHRPFRHRRHEAPKGLRRAVAPAPAPHAGGGADPLSGVSYGFADVCAPGPHLASGHSTNLLFALVPLAYTAPSSL